VGRRHELGVVYHVVNPLPFIHQTYELCNRFAIIDTVCHREPVSGYFIFGDKDVGQYTEGRESYELHPTYRGVIDTIRYAGFREVFEVVGDAERPHPLGRERGKKMLPRGQVVERLRASLSASSCRWSRRCRWFRSSGAG
jgi:hypothetical protein